MFRLDREHIIDATFKGNQARYLNHSCDVSFFFENKGVQKDEIFVINFRQPNCESTVLEIDGAKKIILYAIKDIDKSDEFTYDYKFLQEQDKIQCYCGAKNCQGRLN